MSDTFLKCMMSLTLLAVLLVGGCSSKVVMPPITPDAAGLHYPGKFVWFDLYTDDTTTAVRFYGDVFDWSFERTAQDSGKIKNILHDGMIIGNMIERKKEGKPAQWLSFVSVPDTQRAYDSALADGGTGYLSPRELPERGLVAVIIDPTKAAVALVESSSGDPKDAPLAQGYWLGAELWTRDVDKAVAFYSGLVGYEEYDVNVRKGVAYKLLLAEGRPRAGVVSIPWDRIDPQWVPYVAVLDIEATIEKIKANGGRMLVSPQLDVKSGRVALFADPSGAVVGIQEYEPKED